MSICFFGVIIILVTRVRVEFTFSYRIFNFSILIIVFAIVSKSCQMFPFRLVSLI